MGQEAPTGNITTFVSRLYDFQRRGSVITWLSDEPHGTEVRCMALTKFREAVAGMSALLDEIDTGGNVIPFCRPEA